jgi:SAM-dependent methyltransferase
MFASLLEAYETRYRPGPELWSPLRSEQELWHRIRLFEVLRWGLRHLDVDVNQAHILDVGCGMGQSTRMLLEFGVDPTHVLGIDLLESFASYARKLNPAVEVTVVSGLESWPEGGRFHFCMQCTAFSSIAGRAERAALAARMEDMVCAGGRLFWWDSVRTQPFAGGEPLDPRELFQRSKLIDYRPVSLQPSLWEACRFRGRTARLLCGVFQRACGFTPTHCAAVFAR